MNNALQITDELRYYAYEGDSYTFPVVCHGGLSVSQYSADRDGQCAHQLREMRERLPGAGSVPVPAQTSGKNNWSQALGNLLLESYNKERNLTDRDYRQLYYRLAYPEKFWKIINFYYNSRKSWMPNRNYDKLESLIHQEKNREKLLNKFFS